MRKVNIADLVPGMITAENVYNYVNQLVLPKGLILTDRSITRLEFHSILSIRVEDEIRKIQNTGDNEPTYCEKMRSRDTFKVFHAKFDVALAEFSNVINLIASGQESLKIDKLWSIFSTLIATKEKDVNILDLLQNMRDYDDPTYAHSINVALICYVFSDWMHFSPEDKVIATMCGLLHDIGKLRISEHIISKAEPLTKDEYEIVKTHTLEGYNILKTYRINEHIINSALMHHEKCDGSGYPNKLHGDKIDRFAKMVAIVDVYEAMTSARVYRGSMCPFAIIELFEMEGLQKYDAQYILTFLENVVYAYMQNKVVLNNGMIGDIVFINRNYLSRPTIKTGSTYIDLSMERNLYIQSII